MATMVRETPSLETYCEELEGDTGKAKELWEKKKAEAGKGKGRAAQMQWTDEAVRVMLASVLKVGRTLEMESW
jgi:hypothetical protein